jgi:hypothetical protein
MGAVCILLNILLSHDPWYWLGYKILILVLVIPYFLVFSFKPELGLDAYEDRIEIIWYFCRWRRVLATIEASKIKKIWYVNRQELNPKHGFEENYSAKEEFITAYYLQGFREYSIDSNSPLVSIEAINEHYLIGFTNAQEIVSKLNSKFSENAPNIGVFALQGIDILQSNNIYPAVIWQYRFYVLLYISICWLAYFYSGELSRADFWSLAPFLLIILIIVFGAFLNPALFRLKAFPDHLEIIRGNKAWKRIIVPIGKITSIKTELILLNDYRKNKDWTLISVGLRGDWKVYAVLIETDKNKIALAIPFPDQTVATLRELYGLNSGN